MNPLKSEIPILCLNSSHNKAYLSLWLVTIASSLLVNSFINFLLCLIVAFAWKKCVPASPNWTHLMFLLYFQYNLCFSKRLRRWSSSSLLKFHSSRLKSLWSAKTSKKRIVILTFAIVVFRFVMDAYQSLRHFLSLFSFAVISLALSPSFVGISQFCVKILW